MFKRLFLYSSPKGARARVHACAFHIFNMERARVQGLFLQRIPALGLQLELLAVARDEGLAQ